MPAGVLVTLPPDGPVAVTDNVGVGDSVTDHPANLGQWLARSLDEEGVYYITSDWTDEERFREFERSDRHLTHRQKLHPYRSDGSMVTMRIVAALTGRGIR